MIGGCSQGGLDERPGSGTPCLGATRPEHLPLVLRPASPFNEGGIPEEDRQLRRRPEPGRQNALESPRRETASWAGRGRPRRTRSRNRRCATAGGGRVRDRGTASQRKDPRPQQTRQSRSGRSLSEPRPLSGDSPGRFGDLPNFCPPDLRTRVLAGAHLFLSSCDGDEGGRGGRRGDQNLGDAIVAAAGEGPQSTS